MAIAVFNSNELYILRKIWEDLSERSDSMGINKETFLEYIPMNGLLGERIFYQFDKDQTGYISYQSFIDGLRILCLGTISEQTRFLFEVFDVKKTGKILKQDLITILNHIPQDIFWGCNSRKKSIYNENCNNDFLSYTNYCHCEDAFVHNEDYLNYEDFCYWVKHTPALLGYIKSVIPSTSEEDIIDINNKFILWKRGERTGFILKRYGILRGNCLYYYYSKSAVNNPKGIIFLAGSIIENISEPEMELKGYYGFQIIRHHDDKLHNACEHEKRIFYCESINERNNIVHKLQHMAHIVPFEEDYKRGIKIGDGAFSQVFECENKKTKEKFAVKIINKKIFEKVSRNELNNEIAILRLVFHPNIIHLKDTYEDKENIYIVIELIKDGDFLEYIAGKPCFDEIQLKPIIKQLLEAVAYLHEFGIVHCDIKPENILYNKSTGNIIKLTDFGLSKMMFSDQKLDIKCGTLQYVAPEILTSNKCGMESDMWGIGVIMYLLLNGSLPYVEDTVENILFEYINKKLTFKNTISNECVDLILKLLDHNPQTRINAKDALLHPFIIS